MQYLHADEDDHPCFFTLIPKLIVIQFFLAILYTYIQIV